MQKQAHGWDLTSLLDMLRRRRWVALMTFLGTLVFTVSFVTFLPDVYTSSALILVEGQQIPEDYVRSTVRMPVHQRLYTISQQALSRSRLERLSQDFKLYEDNRQSQSLDDVIASIRKSISIDIKASAQGPQAGALAFSIGYSGTDPQTTVDIANTLASFYIEENSRMRENQAVGTSDFLQTELQKVKATLEEQEQKVTEYKKLYLGELPEQRDANLKTLERLQIQLQLLSENLARMQERRNALTYQINAAAAGGPVLSGPDTIGVRIQDLRRQLAELRTRFHENYPDVQQAKQELAALQEQLKNPPQGADPNQEAARAFQTFSLTTPFQVQLKELDGEARVLAIERAKLLRDITLYQARIENTPKREQDLLLLTRDYNSTRELYASLLKRQEEANLAGNMERRQKGEQLRILDPALYPETPSGPARPLLFLVALVLSLGAAAVGVIVWEKAIDQSFHYPEELEAFTKTPVLATIPDIVTADDRAQSRRRQYLGAVAFAASLLLLVGASYRFAADNEQIVIKLGARPNPGAPDVRFQFLR
jgi:polysaccharide chain length determinant protein (PEP-CTERM system associated)